MIGWNGTGCELTINIGDEFELEAVKAIGIVMRAQSSWELVTRTVSKVQCKRRFIRVECFLLLAY